MAELGPRTLKAIAEGMPFHSAGIGTPLPMESMQDFARRVALIAQEEERERCAKVCEDAAEYHRRFADGVAQFLCTKNAAAIREGK